MEVMDMEGTMMTRAETGGPMSIFLRNVKKTRENLKLRDS